MREDQTLVVRDTKQLSLWVDKPIAEDPAYLSRQLITYIGKSSVPFSDTLALRLSASSSDLAKINYRWLIFLAVPALFLVI